MTNKDDQELNLSIVADEIIRSRRIVAFTGAGVSTESGIPDFRSPGGIWSRFDPWDFTMDRFLSNESSRRKQWQILREGGFFGVVEPNPAHFALARLEELGKLDCVITQNIDNLHQKAGNTPDRVLELHGNMQWIVCLDCTKRYKTDAIVEQLKSTGMDVPQCEDCGGILKPDVVFFGESLPYNILNASVEYSKSCDLFIAIGSSLAVTPAAYMPSYALESGAKLVIINIGETPLDSRANVLIQGKAGLVMSRIIEKVSQRLCV
ncbi:MAG: Sir2 family NAD-dependent protein deacetylase [Syntrophales bacterium]|nr:Sir2 family NAD-dependent protein deacetylase [Syntrophales bacterium]